MRKKSVATLAASSVLALCLAGTSVQAGSGEISEELVLELKKMVEQQQKQLNQQAADLDKLRKQLEGNSQTLAGKADQSSVDEIKADEKVVTSKFDSVNVKLYGHLNRGALWSENGDASKTYFVDNSNSQSRIAVAASVAATDDLTAGGIIEYGIKSNASSDVNQLNTNDATSVNWNLRHADIFFDSKTFGKFSIGHGSTATDGTAEVDLSGTTVVTYSDFGAVAGGQLFYDGTTETLSELQVKSVYNNMDGLGRDDRFRYDTPSLMGFTLSGSAISGNGYDTALRYSRQYGDTKVGAAIAWAHPGDAISSVKSQYDGSISVLLGNGLNATFASGLRDMQEDREDDPFFWYTKLGYQADFFEVGKTSFSIDYAENSAIALDNDKSKLWSVAAVQNVPDWGTEFYMAFRQYKLDRDTDNFENVNAVLAGARLKF